MDLIAFKIGGWCTLRALIDISLNFPECVIRSGLLLGFFSDMNKSFIQILNWEINIAKKSSNLYGDRDKGKCFFDESFCFDKLLELGINLGLRFKEQNDIFIKKHYKDKGIKINNKDECESLIDIQCNKTSCDNNCDSLLKILIKHEFSDEEVSDIKDKLQHGIIANTKDPKKILEAYYHNCRYCFDNDYLATLHSIISTKYNK